MATRKGINICGNYAALHILHALFIYVLCIKKNERSERIVFYIRFKLNDHPTRCFYFGLLSRIHPNGCIFELNF